MNIKPKTPNQKKSIQILARKTDQLGRTLYQVVHSDTKQITWELFKDVKEYHKQIVQFQRRYEDNIQWNLNAETNQPLQHKSNSSLTNIRDKNNWTMLEHKGNDKKRCQNKAKIIKENANNREREETSAKSPIATEDNKPKQETVPTNKQTNSKNDSKQSKSILKLLKRNRKIQKNLDKKVPNKLIAARQSDLIKQIEVKQIKKIFTKSKIWFAQILTTENQTIQVLRDELRVLSPQLLLAYYQEQYQIKCNKFSNAP